MAQGARRPVVSMLALAGGLGAVAYSLGQGSRARLT